MEHRERVSTSSSYEAPKVQMLGSVAEATQGFIIALEADQTISAGQNILGKTSF